MREALKSVVIPWRLLRCRASVPCWCLGQCTMAGNSSVGFCECNLGAGHTSHPLRLLMATFLMVLRLAMQVTSLPTCSQPSAPPDTASHSSETSLIPSVLTLWVILIRVTQCAGAMEDRKETLAGLSPVHLYPGLSQHQWVPSNSPGPSMASHDLLHLHTIFSTNKEGSNITAFSQPAERA